MNINQVLGADLPSFLSDSLFETLYYIYFIEFLPVFITIFFFLYSLKKFRSNEIEFCVLKGDNYKKTIKLKSLITIIFLSIAITIFSGFFLPRVLQSSIAESRTKAFNTLLINPNTIIRENKPLQLFNSNILIEKITSGRNGWKIQNFRLFSANPKGGELNLMIHCTELVYTKLYKRLGAKNCLISNLYADTIRKSWHYQKKSEISLNLKEARDLFEKYLFSDNILKKLPISIRKYTYTSAYIIDFLLKRPCPGGNFELADRIFYFISFYLYCFLSISIVSIIYRYSTWYILMIFLYLILFLPGLSLLFRLKQHKENYFLHIIYFWPVIGATLIYLYYIFKRRLHFDISNRKIN